MHHADDLISIFNQCFLDKYRTQLMRGGDEPLYVPAGTEYDLHTIYFAYGYFSSALHECSHWLIAGKERRKLTDFGYWYAPDGRTAEQQALFQNVEVKPQALEWILSAACGYRFQVSSDNLNGEEGDAEAFKQAILNQVMFYCEHGLPYRARVFRQALCEFYAMPGVLDKELFVDLVNPV